MNEIKNEIWKDIDGFISYQVSSLGRVASFKGKRKILQPAPTGEARKYLALHLCKNKKRVNCKIHRLVYFAFNPDVSKDNDVHHVNKNTFDNRIENLVGINKKEHTKMHAKEKIYINKIKNWDNLF